MPFFVKITRQKCRFSSKLFVKMLRQKFRFSSKTFFVKILRQKCRFTSKTFFVKILRQKCRFTWKVRLKSPKNYKKKNCDEWKYILVYTKICENFPNFFELLKIWNKKFHKNAVQFLRKKSQTKTFPIDHPSCRARNISHSKKKCKISKMSKIQKKSCKTQNCWIHPNFSKKNMNSLELIHVINWIQIRSFED